ncbi:VWA domain-containing protein [Brachyspira intermedia]|uniref:VWA domain-containing protein n=1 Tax=Brachyspira intermedia TaxID=84377 RepID=UPI0030065F93
MLDILSFLFKKDDIKNQLYTEFPQYAELFEDEEFSRELDKKINDYNENLDKELSSNNPLKNEYDKYNNAYSSFKNNGADENRILNDINNYKNFDKNSDYDFYNKKLNDIKNKHKEEYNNINNDYNALEKVVLNDWKNSLDREYTKWALDKIDERRKEFFKDIKNLLEYLKDIKEIKESLGDETGELFDLSLGKIAKRDINYIKKLANFLKNHKNIKELCDMLGRFMKAEESIKIEKVLRKETFKTKKIDTNSQEEIVGITYSRDIHNILPQEKLLLAEGVLETLFGIKYFENRLLTFKKEGYIDSYYDRYIEEEIQVKEEDKKGPIIICVDTSGSMSGVPETVSKAITLYLATRAMKQKRNCYLINFSTQIETMDLTYPNTMDNLIDFLRLSFNGGTDAVPALRHAVKIMNTENYKKSDLIFISDFVFNGFTDKDYKLAEEQKKNENRFYSLIIGSTPMFNVENSIFDYNWCYDSSRGSVKDITGNMYSSIFGH